MTRNTPDVKCLRQRVAELTRTLKTLRESEMNYRSLFDQSSDAIVVFAPNTLTMVQFNNEACRRLGYSRKEFAKLKLSDLEVIESAEDLKRHVRKVPQNRVEVFETKQRTKRGALLDVEIRTRAVCIDGKRLIQAVWRDITQNKRAEQALRESEERYRLMVEAVPMLAWRCDAAGLIIDVNKQWLEYTGQSQNAVRGTGWTTALHPDDQARAFRQVNTGLASLVSVQAEGRVRRAADGQYRWHLARALPIKDAHGKIVAWFGCAADIEDQKRAEEALRLTNEQLERKVRERTARLRQMAAELTKAEYRERRRIADMLHEQLQQHLCGMKFQVNAMQETISDPTAIGLAARLLDECDRAIDMTRTLATDLHPPVLAHLGIKDGIEWLATDVMDKLGLEVKTIVDRGFASASDGVRPGFFKSDEIRMFVFEAVRELLMNVLKHAKVKNAEVRLSPITDGLVRIQVMDRGMGFDTKQDNEPNSHFGLFRIQERAESFGGSFKVTSQPGKGTRTTLILPQGKHQE